MGRCLTYQYESGKSWKLTNYLCFCVGDSDDRSIVYPKSNIPQTGDYYPVLVNYDMNPRDMIFAARFDYLDEPLNNLSIRFKTNRTGCAEITIKLNSRPSNIGRPAEFHELVAFSATYPNVPVQFIVGQGSKNELGEYPYIYTGCDANDQKKYRRLGQYGGGDGWSKNWFYAIVISESRIPDFNIIKK